MFRRLYARHNRGRVSLGQITPSPSPSAPIDDNWLGFWHADDAEGDPTDPVASLTPRSGAVNLEASVPGVISESTLSDDRRTIDLNGSSQFMEAHAIAAALSGSNVAFTVHLHCQVIGSPADLDTLWSLGNSTTAGDHRHSSYYRTSGTLWHTLREGGGGATQDVSAVVSMTGEIVMVQSFSAAALTRWFNGTKTDDAEDFATADATFDLFTLGCRAGSSTRDRFFPMAVRSFGIRAGGVSDANAATLFALLGK